jgi:hypothetical protein
MNAHIAAKWSIPAILIEPAGTMIPILATNGDLTFLLLLRRLRPLALTNVHILGKWNTPATLIEPAEITTMIPATNGVHMSVFMRPLLLP